MLQWERKTYPRQVITRVVETTNPVRPRYIYLYNLFTLLNFTIPSVQDYGVALKLADVELFLKAYIQLYITILNSNSSLYMRCMLLDYLLIVYWKDNDMIIYKLLKQNVTFFSEESGELAISYLAQTQSPTHRADINVTNHRWLDVREKYEQRRDGIFKPQKESKKKYREVK